MPVAISTKYLIIVVRTTPFITRYGQRATYGRPEAGSVLTSQPAFNGGGADGGGGPEGGACAEAGAVAATGIGPAAAAAGADCGLRTPAGGGGMGGLGDLRYVCM